jgi:hypothetical protein
VAFNNPKRVSDRCVDVARQELVVNGTVVRGSKRHPDLSACPAISTV